MPTPSVRSDPARAFDGTGGPARAGQTVLIRGNRIEAVGAAGSVDIPSAAERLDFAGHSVMPGMVGLHDHMFYYQSTPRASQMQYSGPRLYIGAGVTTVRTTGSVAPYQDISLKGAIERGETPGPRMVITAPYVISPGPDERLRDLGMYVIRDEEAARRYVRYWAAEGTEWVKAYTQITREALGTVIDEAHRQGMKVMAQRSTGGQNHGRKSPKVNRDCTICVSCRLATSGSTLPKKRVNHPDKAGIWGHRISVQTARREA